MEKHSAYASMRLKKNKPTAEGTKDLIDWTRAKWINLTAKITDNKTLPCGTKGKKQLDLNLPSVCRPTVKVNSKTPTLASSYSKEEIRKAIEIKKQGKTINWKTL